MHLRSLLANGTTHRARVQVEQEVTEKTEI